MWRRLIPMLPWRTTSFGTLIGCCRMLVIGTCVTLMLMVSSGLVATGTPAPSAADKGMAPLPQTVPVPKENPTTPEKVALGTLLFFDSRLSGDNKISCATCHRPDKAFGDG